MVAGHHSPPGARVAGLTWPEVRDQIARGACGWLPVAAAAKEHGPHLPMNTDLLQAEWLTDRVLRSYPLLAWPSISYGYYPAFTAYAGSSHLSHDVFVRLVREIVAGIFAHGARRVFILNTGVSTIEPLQMLAAEHAGTVLINAYAGPRCREVSARLLQSGPGGHADERETSLMLAIDAQCVALDRLPGRDQTNLGPGPLQWRDPAARNYSPSGIVGDARAASAEKGHKFLAAILEDLAAVVEKNIKT